MKGLGFFSIYHQKLSILTPRPFPEITPTFVSEAGERPMKPVKLYHNNTLYQSRGDGKGLNIGSPTKGSK